MTVDSARPEPVLDLEGTLARFGGDKVLFAEISSIVLEDAPRVIADLRRALAANDATAVRAHAHALKGLVAGCGGVRAAQLAQSLEDAGHCGQLKDCPATMESFETEFNQLATALRAYQL